MIAHPFRAEVRREQAARTTSNTADAALRRALRAEVRAAEVSADWTNLPTMLAQPGRRPTAALVERIGRRAEVPAAEIARVVATLGAAS